MRRVDLDKNQILTLYNAIPEESDEEMKKYVNLRDLKITSREDLVKVCQTFRNPKYETFRIIYMRDDNIVNYETITSRLPNSCDIFRVKAKTERLKRIKGYEDIAKRMYRLGANGYYLQHNHPSGNAKASINDVWVTQEIDENVKGFKGHVIVNSGTYATIERENGALSKLVANNEMVIENYKPDDIDKLISKEPWANIKINSNKQIATLMHDVKNNPNYSTLILTDSQSYPRILLDIPNNFFNMSSSQIDGYIKNISKHWELARVLGLCGHCLIVRCACAICPICFQ